jgi:hypothetical protein
MLQKEGAEMTTAIEIIGATLIALALLMLRALHRLIEAAESTNTILMAKRTIADEMFKPREAADAGQILVEVGK